MFQTVTVCSNVYQPGAIKCSMYDAFGICIYNARRISDF